MPRGRGGADERAQLGPPLDGMAEMLHHTVLAGVQVGLGLVTGIDRQPLS